MNRANRQLLIEAFRRLRIQAEQGEEMARAIFPQDIGPMSKTRTAEVVKLLAQAERLASTSALVLKSIQDHIGATEAIDRSRFPRAKPLSASLKKDP